METILVYSLLTSAAFYLGSRAVITRWLWSRYPAWLASFADCSACSGFWYGCLFGALARWVFFYPGTEIPSPRILVAEWYSPILVGLCSIVWTPIVAGLMQRGFEQLGSALPADGEEERPEPTWRNIDG